MPTRGDWEAACPKCPQRIDGDGKPAVDGDSTRCYKLLHYDMVKQHWRCPDHGHVIAAALAAAERRAAETQIA